MVNICAFAFQLSTRRRILHCCRQAAPSIFMQYSSIYKTAIATGTTTRTARPSSNLTTDDEERGTTRPQPLHILGAGSMGLLFATLIRQQFPAYPLQLLLTPRHASKLQNVGRGTTKKHVVTVSIQESFRDESNNNSNKRSRPVSPRLVEIPARLVTEYQDPECKYTISNLLVTTKAFQAKAAIESIQHCFSCYNNNNNGQEQDDDDDAAQCPTTRIILLCNGALAVQEELRKHFDAVSTSNNFTGRCPVVHLGWTTHGAQRIHSTEGAENDDDFFHLIHAGFGQTAIQDCPDLAPAFSINCESVSSNTIRQQLWTKLAANCVINPLTALKGCKNGDLIQHLQNMSEISNTVHQVIEEVVRVARAQEQGGKPLSVEAVSDFCRQVMVDTAENQSSMLVDVLARRPTEIEYLSGYVAQQGRTLGISCPANELLCRQIQELTEGYTK